MESPTSPTSTLFSPIAKQPPLALPSDVNASESTGASDDLVSSGPRKWYSRLYLPWPLLYIIHISSIIMFGFAALGLKMTNREDGRERYHVAFWCCFSTCIGMIFSLVIFLFLYCVMIPGFWRKTAKAVVRDGTFSPFYDTFNKSYNPRHVHRTVLEIGCNDGHVSAMFAKEIISAQKETDLGRRAPELPISVGYDMWKWWIRMPNTPKVYLKTFLDANVPRDHIIANRVDLTSKETKLHLPYADNSISFIISNIGLPEVTRWYSAEEQRAVFKELARVLEG